MATEFGKYILQRKLAEGGMAEVFLAKQSGMDGFEKPVVVKRILPQLTSDHTFVEMFINEARVAARLSHPAIVQIFDLGKVDDQYYIAMEFIHGEDLRTLAKAADQHNKRPPMPLVVRVVADMLGGLHYAHTRAGGDGKPLGLVHRDISPQNVLVTYEGGVKVVDFGIAKATESASSQQTQAGLLKGKFAYMSPEQCRGKKLDARSDIFAVGIVLWELLTWRRLFRRDNDLATLVAVADEPIPLVSSVLPDVPVELDLIVQRALARSLDERYPSAQAMQNDLEGVVRKYGWAADSIRLQQYMREVFADKLRAQDEAVRAAGVGSLDDLLAKVGEGEALAWMEPVFQSGRTPSADVMLPQGSFTPHRGVPNAPQRPVDVLAARSQSGPVRIMPVPDAPRGYGTPSAQMRVIQPVPGPAPDHSEVTPSTLRHAVGQALPVAGSARATPISVHAVARGRAAAPSGWKRLLIVGGTSLLLAGAVLAAVLWPDGEAGEAHQPAGEPATVHVVLDAEAQIYVDNVRQLPGRVIDVSVDSERPHEVRVRRGEVEKRATVPRLQPGATHTVELKVSEP